jgi:hypothetical protein
MGWKSRFSEHHDLNPSNRCSPKLLEPDGRTDFPAHVMTFSNINHVNASIGSHWRIEFGSRGLGPIYSKISILMTSLERTFYNQLSPRIDRRPSNIREESFDAEENCIAKLSEQSHQHRLKIQQTRKMKPSKRIRQTESQGRIVEWDVGEVIIHEAQGREGGGSKGWTRGD